MVYTAIADLLNVVRAYVTYRARREWDLYTRVLNCHAVNERIREDRRHSTKRREDTDTMVVADTHARRKQTMRSKKIKLKRDYTKLAAPR